MDDEPSYICDACGEEIVILVSVIHREVAKLKRSLDEKMGRFLARGIVEDHSALDDALDEIRKQTHWNDAMRDAAIGYAKAALGYRPTQ